MENNTKASWWKSLVSTATEWALSYFLGGKNGSK